MIRNNKVDNWNRLVQTECVIRSTRKSNTARHIIVLSSNRRNIALAIGAQLLDSLFAVQIVVDRFNNYATTQWIFVSFSRFCRHISIVTIVRCCILHAAYENTYQIDR